MARTQGWQKNEGMRIKKNAFNANKATYSFAIIL